MEQEREETASPWPGTPAKAATSQGMTQAGRPCGSLGRRWDPLSTWPGWGGGGAQTGLLPPGGTGPGLGASTGDRGLCLAPPP